MGLNKPVGFMKSSGEGESPFSGHATLTEDLDHYYKADDSGSFPDSTGGSDGTINGATYTASGKINGAYDFDGNNDTIDLGFSVDSGYNTAFTVSHWVKLDTLDNDSRPTITTDVATSGRGFTIYFDTSGWGMTNTVFTWVHDGSTIRVVSADNGAITTGVWYHIVVTWDNSSNTLNLYLNGSNVNNIKSSGTPGNMALNEFVIGFNTGQQNYFGGIVDEVGFWKRVLTTDEISDLYNSGDGLTY